MQGFHSRHGSLALPTLSLHYSRACAVLKKNRHALTILAWAQVRERHKAMAIAFSVQRYMSQRSLT